MIRCFFSCALIWLAAAPAVAEISPDAALVFLDFEDESLDGVKLIGGAKRAAGKFGHALEFRTQVQHADLPFDRKLDGLSAISIGGWFFTRRQGEQYFFSRGLPQIAEDANRRFPAEKAWVNFVLGTDQRGFVLGTINGNGTMPFPYVTVNELAIDAWHQTVVVKDRRGTHHFYHNGAPVHSSGYATETARRFIDTDSGDPIRLHMPHGGLVGEAWIFGRALTAEEVRADFEAKWKRYHPAHPGRAVVLREMDAHPAANLWKKPLTADIWPAERKRIEQGVFKIFGAFPKEKPSLDPQTHGKDEDCGSYVRRKISIQVQPNDRMPCWLLIPKELLTNKPARRVPAIICFYGTTSGAGKDVTVGLSGRAPGTTPVRNLAFAIDIAEAGFVALAPDYLRDGDRIKPGRRPYDTTDFYERFPDWSIHGKDVWDTMRAIDYLQTLDFVDADKIGMTGHSYGGHSTIFAAALEPRIKVAVANGPVSDFLHHGMHWAVPKGGGASQSLPAMRPYVLDHTLPIPVTFYEFTALIAPKPLLVGQAAGEHRPMEEENYAAVGEVYAALGHADRVRYLWYAGDHDYPPPMRKAAVAWFRHWFDEQKSPGPLR
ncbi:MAG: prolyl oligopeptidase family serine peptidase [Pirellulales bacterium]